jgi:hypothetical protein
MKKLVLSIFLILNLSCSNKLLPGQKAKKNPFQIQNNTLTISQNLEEFDTYPDSFILFFWPEVGTMTWESKVFSQNDSDEEKLTDIVSHVIKASNDHDDVDREIFGLNSEFEALLEKMMVLDCEDPNNAEECEQMYIRIEEIPELVDVLENRKVELIGEIVKAVDQNNEKPINWQENSGAGKIEIDIAKKYFRLMQVGPYLKYNNSGGELERNSYWSRKGDIFDIEYKESEYAPGTMMLYFKLREKRIDSDDYTGNIYRFELEKMSFLDMVRFQGDVFKETASGEQIQRGVCKFDLAPKEDF